MTRLVLWWVRLYTRGLGPGVRSERLAEVESDAWEQRTAGDGEAAILARCISGLPSDISWRLERSSIAGAPGRIVAALLASGEGSTRWIVERGLPRLTTLLAGCYVLVGVLVLVTMHANENRPLNQLAWFAGWCLVCGAMIVAGSRPIRTHQKIGSALVVCGAVPIALALKVTIVVPAAALVVVVFQLTRARQQARAALRVS